MLSTLLFVNGCHSSSSSDSSSSSLPVGQLQAMLDASVSDNGAPGAILAVRVGNSFWVGAAGKSNLATGEQMTPDMQVRLASVTKSLTAIIVMKLVEENILSLQDTIEKWLPGKVNRGNEMTVEMLLCHRAGVYSLTELEDFWSEMLADPLKDWSSNDILAKTNPLTPMFTPGKEFYYTNTGYYLLGMIVEAATGNPLSDEIQKRILAPLSLTRTNLTRHGFMAAPNEHGYTLLPTTAGVVDTANWNLSWDWTAGSGVSTGSDMLNLSDALFSGRILSPATVDLMVTPTEEGGYGLGIGKTTLFNTMVIGHTGANPGTATLWYYFPYYNTTIFVAVNGEGQMLSPNQKEPIIEGLKYASNIFEKAWKILHPYWPENFKEIGDSH